MAKKKPPKSKADAKAVAKKKTFPKAEAADRQSLSNQSTFRTGC